MAFQYLEGVTAPGAPDEIVDWFATFQAWMTGPVGWIVASGGGTTDLVLRSLSEAGGLTMLFLHVYRDGGLPNRVRVEVMNDAAGTQETTNPGYLDGAGAQFAFWMAGDMDAINICFRGGAVYHSIYAGMVLPFALTVPDETYRTIVTTTQNAGTILRDSTGLWDVDHGLYDSDFMDDMRTDLYDGSFTLAGIYFDRFANIAGQLKHISLPITDPAIPVMTLLTTGRVGATSTWIVLEDRVGTRYAMRTGGVLPTGMPDSSNFVAVTGVAADYLALWAALSLHLVGLGWTAHGDPGVWTEGRLYSSPGESGEDEIFIGYARNAAATDEFYHYVQDDMVPTHRHQLAGMRYLDNLEFPINYWICGDKDCCVLVFQRPSGYTMIWAGLVPSFVPGLLPSYGGTPLTVYQLVSVALGHGVGSAGALLRGHDGIWLKQSRIASEGSNTDNSNPSNFDGTTYLVWPFLGLDNQLGTNLPIGQLRYAGHSSGGGIASMDTITIGGQVYTVFFTNTGLNFCVRTA